MSRLRSCRYCGRIHEEDYVCSRKPKDVKKKRSEEDRLRGLQVWKRKRNEIKERDLYLCQICNRGLYRTINKLDFNTNVQVHHIYTIKERKDLWLDNNNLICLCQFHHELAEKGSIDKIDLLLIAKEQEEINNI